MLFVFLHFSLLSELSLACTKQYSLFYVIVNVNNKITKQKIINKENVHVFITKRNATFSHCSFTCTFVIMLRITEPRAIELCVYRSMQAHKSEYNSQFRVVGRVSACPGADDSPRSRAGR